MIAAEDTVLTGEEPAPRPELIEARYPICLRRSVILEVESLVVEVDEDVVPISESEGDRDRLVSPAAAADDDVQVGCERRFGPTGEEGDGFGERADSGS